MVATHNIKTVTFNEDFIFLHIDGKEIKIPLDRVSKKLKSATEIQKKLFTISPSGYGIHWPLIDEDLSIDSLLNVAGH